MNEFKKWLEKQKPYDPYCCAAMAESAWKAALEKIRHIIMFESDGPSNPKD